MFVFVSLPSVLNLYISKTQRFKNLLNSFRRQVPENSTSNYRCSFPQNEQHAEVYQRLKTFFTVSHPSQISKKGRASILNLMPMLPPQQRPNKQYLSITVSKFVMEGFDFIQRQYSLPAWTDFIQRKGNDKVKCLTYCAVGGTVKYFCLLAFTIRPYKIHYWAFVAANRHLSFLYCPNLLDYRVFIILFYLLPI